MRTVGCLLLFVVLTSFSLPKKLIGHWISEQDAISYMDIGDTLTFHKKKYDRGNYLWGGGVLAGIEFGKDSTFAEHENVMCSDESSDVFNQGSYMYHPDGSIELTSSDDSTFCLRIVRVTHKELVITRLQ